MPQDPLRRIPLIAYPPVGCPRSTEIWACVSGRAEGPLTSRRRGYRALRMANSGKCMELFNAAMDAARYPHASRRLHAETMRIATRQDSRKWIVSQAQQHAQEPQWEGADRVGDIGVTSSKIFRPIGTRQF